MKSIKKLLVVLICSLAAATTTAQPDIYVSFSNFGDGNAIGNKVTLANIGDTIAAYIWVDESFSADTSICLDITSSNPGICEIGTVEVFNPNIEIMDVDIAKRWQAVSGGINATVNSVENICGAAVSGGTGILPSQITGELFEDLLHDPSSNAFLFAKIDLQIIGIGSTSLDLSVGHGGVFHDGVSISPTFCSATVNGDAGSSSDIFGLPTKALGQADLVFDENAEILTVSNIGSSGQDGFRVDLGESEFSAIQLETASADVLPDGAFMSICSRGSMNGQSDTELMKAIIEDIGDEFALTVETTNLGTTKLRVEALLGGTVVQTTAVYDSPWRKLACYPPSGCYGRNCGDLFSMSFDTPIEVTLTGELPIVADEIRVTSVIDTATIDFVSAQEVLVADIPTVVVSNQQVGQFGVAHRARKSARQQTLRDPKRLRVSNLGSSGQDGVDSDVSSQDLAGFKWEDLNKQGPYGEGATLSVAAIGTRAGQENTLLGQLTFTENQSGNKEVVAAYPESSSYRVIVMDDGQVVADIAGHTGLIASVPCFPDRCLKAVVWDDFQLDCLTSRWPDPILINIPGATPGPFIGDELLVLAEQGSPIDRITQLQLRTQEIPEVVLTQVNGFSVGDVNQDGMVNLLDIDGFIAVLGAGLFQDEADINRDGFVDLLDIDPFILLLGG